MRSSLFSCLVLACLLAFVAAWTKEDHEIFRLRDELELNEGEGITFYEFVGVAPSASHKEIEKAYRRRSAQLHPDKAERNFVAQRLAESKKSGDKSGKPRVNSKPSQRDIKKAVRIAQDKYQRLSVIKEILTTEGRVRYDHFLKNGFPQWRSTGYYYQRFRPGVGSVIIGLWVFCGGFAHYGILVLNHRQRKGFMKRTIRKARKVALGDESSIAAIPGIDDAAEPASPPPPAPAADSGEQMPEPRNRKERRMMEKMQAKDNKNGKNSKSATKKKPAVKAAPVHSAASVVPKKRVLSDHGKVLLVANDGTVYLEEEDDEGNTEEYPLDPEGLDTPTFSQTALVQAPFWIANFVQAKVQGKQE